MRIRTLYRYLLLLPLVVPALLLPLGLLHVAPPWLERVIAVCGLAAVVGGIPYALLAVSLLLWLLSQFRNHSTMFAQGLSGSEQR
jgi:ABC-type spermidine/putrescine transport system permease subunit II